MTYGQAKWLATELFLLMSVLMVPLSVHAGVLSMLFGKTAAAEPTPISYAETQNLQTMPLLRAALHTDPNPAKGGGDIIVEDGALVPAGDIAGGDEKASSKTKNGEISLYVVREGDTLSQIAEMFDVSAKTVLWANDLTNADKIRPGDELIILPITGVRHVVKKGDTLKSIVKKYLPDAKAEELASTIEDTLRYNQLASAEDITAGDTIIIPNGIVSAPAPAKGSSARGVATGGGSAGFTHPAPGTVRTQGIHGYNGVDFGGPVGTPIYAAAAGEVIVSKASGWNGGYGLYVVVKHANGTQTLYAHLSRTAVAVGTRVAQGQVIGYMGNTGRSTGSHLHFEVRGARNPF